MTIACRDYGFRVEGLSSFVVYVGLSCCFVAEPSRESFPDSDALIRKLRRVIRNRAGSETQNPDSELTYLQVGSKKVNMVTTRSM